MERNDVKREKRIVSVKGLERTNWIKGDVFEVYFGAQKIECNLFQACFISKAIHRLLMSDRTICKFELEAHEYSVDICEEFSKFIKSGSLELNENNCKDFEFVFRILENEELQKEIDDFEFGKGEVDINNCISRLENKVRNKCNIDEELNFIASHFYMFNSRELERLKNNKIEVLERILSSENLLLKDEDSLVEFISSLGEEYSELYDYVEFEFLSVKGIETFLSCFSLESIDSILWESIFRRLRYEVCNCKSWNKRFTSKDVFPYIIGNEFDGIINFLRKECGGNVHGKRIVNITCSGDGYNKCWEVAYYGWSDYWVSREMSNSWICFDFKEKSISLQHYTLKSGSLTDHYFIQWAIEGSNDGRTWKSLDSQNTKDLCGDFITKAYKCSASNQNEFFRFIRMRQTGKNSIGNFFLWLCNIEFFGRLKI
jgi:hypothetical protein